MTYSLAVVHATRQLSTTRIPTRHVCNVTRDVQTHLQWRDEERGRRERGEGEEEEGRRRRGRRERERRGRKRKEEDGEEGGGEGRGRRKRENGERCTEVTQKVETCMKLL